MNLQPLPLPPDQGAILASLAQQQALTATLGQADPQAGQTIPHAVEPLPASTLYRYYMAWESAKSAEIHEQYLARRYYHSKQWTDAEIRELKRRRQPVVTANRIKRKVDFLVGVEQRLRRDVKAYPRTPEHEGDAHIATAGLRFVQDTTLWPRHASDATHDALIAGIGVIFQGVMLKRGRAEIVKRHVPADRFFYDPRSERWDFSDARYLGVHQWMDIDEAVEMLPQSAEMIDALASSGGSGPGVLPSDWAKEQTWLDNERRRIRIIEIHYKQRSQWLYDYLCGSVSLLPVEQQDRMSPYLDEDDNTTHPYNAWSPYVDEAGNRYGVVRDMFSPQDEINKRRSKMLHMLSVRQTMAEKGAVEDVDAMKRELARPDGHVEINPGATQNGSFQILDQTAQTQGQAELLIESKAEIENLGPNPGLIGRGVEKQSGRAILAQQNSGMTELSPVFERCREWKLGTFRKDWGLVRQFWTGERWIRITGNSEAPQFLGINQIMQDPMMGRVAIRNDITRIDVDIILEEGPDTITMQEELLDQLGSMGPGAVPPEVLIQLSNVKEKEKVLKMISDAKAPPPELQAMAERMAKLEAMLKAAQVDKTRADAEKTRTDALTQLIEAGVLPEDLGAFPLTYREPTEVERMGAALDASVAPPPGAPQPPSPPQGGGANPAALAGMPRPPNPMGPGEPRLNQAGGLPMPGAPPGVPMQ